MNTDRNGGFRIHDRVAVMARIDALQEKIDWLEAFGHLSTRDYVKTLRALGAARSELAARDLHRQLGGAA